MARIAGINIPPHKHAEIGLTSIYGIGRTTAQKICEKAGIAFSKKIKDLSDADLEKIRQAGATVVRLSAAEKSDLETRFSKAGSEWAGDLDRRGKPGSETLKAFSEAVASTRQRRP